MNINEHIILQTIEFVKKEVSNAEGSHDWWHIHRVWQLSKKISRDEGANTLIVELSALLHDIADSKFHEGDETIGPKKAKQFLKSIHVDEFTIDAVVKIIENISFKGGNFTTTYSSLELNVVQDADRLDAIGAIGVARTFSYGGYKNRKIFDPTQKPSMNMSKEEYKNNETHTINHFYEKLLLLKERMNTPTAKKIAEERHTFMMNFLEQFYKEWNFIDSEIE